MTSTAPTEKGEPMEDKLSALPFLLLGTSQFILFFMLDFRLDCIERKLEREEKNGRLN